MIARRYTHKIIPGQWDIDRGTVHEVDPMDQSRTLCGVKIGRRLEHGGPWDVGKYLVGGKVCERCEKKLAASRIV